MLDERVPCPSCRKVMERGRMECGDYLYVCTGCQSGYMVFAGTKSPRMDVLEQDRKFHEVADKRNTHVPSQRTRRSIYFK